MTKYYTVRNVSMEATISELGEYFKSIPDDLGSRKNEHYRALVDRVIDIQGSKEITIFEKTVRKREELDLVSIAREVAYGLKKRDINDKKSYSKKLFRLVRDNNIPNFFDDLEKGLDYAIDQWDTSQISAKEYNYQTEPTGAKIIHYLKPKRTR